VTWLPRATLMFFGATTLFAIVIVFELTASDGAAVGVLGDGDDELEFEPQATMAQAPAIATAMQTLRGFTVFILPLDSTRSAASHSLRILSSRRQVLPVPSGPWRH